MLEQDLGNINAKRNKIQTCKYKGFSWSYSPKVSELEVFT